MNIRLLTTEDWKTWKEFRLAALQNSPENFCSSYEEEADLPDSDFQDQLNKNDIFGAFINDSLASCAAFYSLTTQKTKHRGVIWGMYTHSDYRGHGIANALIQKIIDHAKSKVIQLQLSCLTNNLAAINLYQKHGFNI